MINTYVPNKTSKQTDQKGKREDTNTARIIEEDSEHLYGNQFDNLDERDKALENHKLPKLTEEGHHLIGTLSVKECSFSQFTFYFATRDFYQLEEIEAWSHGYYIPTFGQSGMSSIFRHRSYREEQHKIDIRTDVSTIYFLPHHNSVVRLIGVGMYSAIWYHSVLPQLWTLEVPCFSTHPFGGFLFLLRF